MHFFTLMIKIWHVKETTVAEFKGSYTLLVQNDTWDAWKILRGVNENVAEPLDDPFISWETCKLFWIDTQKITEIF